MSFNNTVTVNYNSTAYTLNRSNGPNNNTGEFFYRSPTLDLRLQFGHLVPASGKVGESHSMTLWVHEYDVDGVEIARDKVVYYVQSQLTKQDDTRVTNLDAAARDFLGTNVSTFIARGA